MNQREADSPFKNVNLRKAISYSINRDALVKQVLGDGSVVSTGLIPADMSKNPETNEDFAKEQANLFLTIKIKQKNIGKKRKKNLALIPLNSI